MCSFTSPRRARGLSTLNEGQIVQYEIVSNRGKESAENLKLVADRPDADAGTCHRAGLTRE